MWSTFCSSLSCETDNRKKICRIKAHPPRNTQVRFRAGRKCLAQQYSAVLPGQATVWFQSDHTPQHDSVFPRYQEQLGVCTVYPAPGAPLRNSESSRERSSVDILRVGRSKGNVTMRYVVDDVVLLFGPHSQFNWIPCLEGLLYLELKMLKRLLVGSPRGQPKTKGWNL